MDAAREVAATIVERGGPQPVLTAFDLADRKAADAAVVALLDQNGPPDALVLNAGITHDGLFALTSNQEWDEILDTNLGGLLAVGRPVLKAMVRVRAGRIVLVSSVASQIGNSGQVAYAASKGALNSAALSLAREVAALGITVNVVVPGLIETEMLEHAPLEKLLAAVPAGRLGRPAEVAHVIRYFCSDASGCLTGQIVNVDGGMVPGRHG